MSENEPSAAEVTPPKRQRRTLAEAQALVEQWRASGQNQEAFCRSLGILRSTLVSCRRRTGDMVKRRRSQGAATRTEAGFVQVVGPAGHPEAAAGAGACLIVTTADGIQFQVGSAGHVGLIAPALAAVRQVAG